VLAEAADTLAALRRDLDRADGLAQIHGLMIGPDATVSAVVLAADPVSAQRQAAGQVEAVGLVERVLARAGALDAAVTDALARAAAGAVDDGTGDTLAGAANNALGVQLRVLEPRSVAPRRPTPCGGTSSRQPSRSGCC
jgi:hypothetical protein